MTDNRVVGRGTSSSSRGGQDGLSREWKFICSVCRASRTVKRSRVKNYRTFFERGNPFSPGGQDIVQQNARFSLSTSLTNKTAVSILEFFRFRVDCSSYEFIK